VPDVRSFRDCPLEYASVNGHLGDCGTHMNSVFRWDSSIVCDKAAGNGQHERLLYLRDNSVPRDSATCREAAPQDNLKCLKYARENDCSLNSTTSDEAATGGYLCGLVHEHNSGCFWVMSTCNVAAKTVIIWKSVSNGTDPFHANKAVVYP